MEKRTMGELILMAVDQAPGGQIHPWALTDTLRKLKDVGYIEQTDRINGKPYEPQVKLTAQGAHYLRQKGVKTNG